MYEPFPDAERLEPNEDEKEMFDWAREQGIKWPKIIYPVRFPPGYIGSMAIDEILPGERIVTAPNSALFTSKVAQDSELKSVFAECPETFTKSMLVLVTYMIWEKYKGSESKWAAFIKYQPKNPTTIQDWTTEELDVLQDYDLKIDAEQRKKYLVYGWNHWKSTLEKFPQFTSEMLKLEEYTWAFRVIGTRSFGKFMPYITLIPVGELLNHDNVETYYIYQKESDTPDASSRYSGIVDQIDHDDELLTNDPIINLKTEIILNINEELNKQTKDLEKILLIKSKCREIDAKEEAEAKEHKKYRPPDMDLTESDEKCASIVAGPNEHYKPGSEVYMSYGRYSNRQLLSTYGFALKENYYNYARVKFLLKDLAANHQQSEFFSDIDAFIIFKLKKFSFSREFIRTLRGINWKNEDPCEAFLNAKIPKLEALSLSIMIRALNSKLDKFPTTLEEDDAKISEPGLALRTYFAILYRRQVKEMIKAQIRYAEIALKIVGKLEEGKSLDEAVGRIEGENNHGMSYLDYNINRAALREYIDEFRSN
ncbi:hypothetical protein SteCoe_16493 [Stentor coeruleus]|uniref:Rubisco LSMT substrate-binding domain-containing protein n=1 Tax=Stentor coeruleus TaxID=5963 RepID=A0A1R2C129_9CILI|nr:hypothetical protein SteCoe_16493 [Stentor coeruleus]